MPTASLSVRAGLSVACRGPTSEIPSPCARRVATAQRLGITSTGRTARSTTRAETLPSSPPSVPCRPAPSTITETSWSSATRRITAAGFPDAVDERAAKPSPLASSQPLRRLAVGELGRDLVPVTVEAADAPDEIAGWVKRQLVLGRDRNGEHDRVATRQQHARGADRLGRLGRAVEAEQHRPAGHAEPSSDGG